MNTLFSIPVALIAALPAVCCMVQAQEKEFPSLTPEQKTLTADFHASLPELIEALQAAAAALRCISNTASADEAVPAIRRVSRAEAKVMAAAEKLTAGGVNVEQLYLEENLADTLSTIPSAAYNKLVQQELAEGCHGSVLLYLALAEDTNTYTEKQLHAQLTDTDKADLQQVTHTLNLLAEIAPISHWRPKEDEFVKAYDQSCAAAERLQQKPHTAMLLRRLLEQHYEALHELCNNSFHNNGDLEERFILRPDNYLGRYYSRQGLAHYFSLKAHGWDMTVGSGEKIYQRLIDRAWQEAAPRLAAYRRKHDLGKGDGRSPETAFQLPAGVKDNRGDYSEFVNAFTKDVFGERHLPCAYQYGDMVYEGKLVIYGLVNIGRTGNRNLNNDPILVMPCYFYAPLKKNEQ